MAYEISEVAREIKWFKQPEMAEFETMAEICATSGYSYPEVMDTPAAKREPSHRSLASERPAWARVFRRIPDSAAPPVETKAKPAP